VHFFFWTALSLLIGKCWISRSLASRKFCEWRVLHLNWNYSCSGSNKRPFTLQTSSNQTTHPCYHTSPLRIFLPSNLKTFASTNGPQAGASLRHQPRRQHCHQGMCLTVTRRNSQLMEDFMLWIHLSRTFN
jgi:hypothetical protein